MAVMTLYKRTSELQRWRTTPTVMKRTTSFNDGELLRQLWTCLFQWEFALLHKTPKKWLPLSVMNSPTPKNAQNLYVGDEVSFPRMPKRASSSVMKSLFFQPQKSLELQLLRHSRCGVHPSTKRFLFQRLPQKRPPKCLAVQKCDWQ